MFGLNVIIGAVTGALSGATGGKVSLDRVVDKAVQKAAQSPATDLTHKDAPKVAEAVKGALPAPRAMESLVPQNARLIMVAIGGYFVGKGYLQQADMEALVTAALIVGPILYRNVSTWIARWRAAKV